MPTYYTDIRNSHDYWLYIVLYICILDYLEETLLHNVEDACEEQAEGKEE